MRRSISLMLFLVIFAGGGYTYKAKAFFDPSFIVEYNALKDIGHLKSCEDKGGRIIKATLPSSKAVTSKTKGSVVFGFDFDYLFFGIYNIKDWFISWYREL